MLPAMVMSPCERNATAGLVVPVLINVTVMPEFKLKLEKVNTNNRVPALVKSVPAKEAPPVICLAFKFTTTLLDGLKMPSDGKSAGLRKELPAGWKIRLF